MTLRPAVAMLSLGALVAACQQLPLEEAAKQRTLEIVEATIPGVQDVALTNIAITADEQYRLHVCATASAANLPPKPIIANLEFRSLIADELMNLSAVTGGETPECNAEARRRFYAATPEQKKRWEALF